MHFGKYLKTAFLNHWNLLAFLSGLGFAVVTGLTDVAGPLVLAGEITYLGLLASHPRFQAYVDAQEAKSRRQEASADTQVALEQILRALPKTVLDRFVALRSQCVELRQLAQQLKGPLPHGIDQPLEQSQTSGLDRLLWSYLRLLYTRVALGRFLEKTPERDIQQDLARYQERLQKLPADAQNSPNPQNERIRKVLEENIATCQERLANLAKARDNYQLFDLQIDQLENTIRSISERAVNSREPEFISNQIEQVNSSMVQTEQTMNELRFATGLESLSDDAPELLRGKLLQVAR